MCQAMQVSSEGLESFGGQGYIEDTGLPGILRDAQVMCYKKAQGNGICRSIFNYMLKN